MNRLFPKNWQTAMLAMVVVGVILLALSGFMTPLLKVALDPLIGAQGWLSTRYMAMVEFLTVPRDVASLRSRNLQLEAEVTDLQKQVIELQQQLQEAQVLYSLFDYGRSNPENAFIAAKVLGRDTSPFIHYIYIDHGSDDGLRHGMPVVTQQGLVGRIDAVTASAARVQLITDTNSAINVRLETVQADAQMVGSLTGDISLQMIPQDVDLQPGELVLTSGLGGGYPSNILIGQVSSVRKLETDLFQSATVQAAVDFRNLQAVLVVTNFKPVDYSPLQPTSNP